MKLKPDYLKLSMTQFKPALLLQHVYKALEKSDPGKTPEKFFLKLSRNVKLLNSTEEENHHI